MVLLWLALGYLTAKKVLGQTRWPTGDFVRSLHPLPIPFLSQPKDMQIRSNYAYMLCKLVFVTLLALQQIGELLWVYSASEFTPASL